MQNQLPTIRNYGHYSSDNYGANSLEMSFPNGFSISYSYDTPIAFIGREGLVIRENDWSTTTGKHLNWINEDKSRRISGEEFEKLLTLELEHYGLGEIEKCAQCGDAMNGRVRVHHHTEVNDKGVEVDVTKKAIPLS